MERKRVVVTGTGTVNPIGHNVNETWEAARSGKNGIDKVSLFDVTHQRCKIAGEVKNFDASNLISSKELRRMSRFLIFALSATHEAMENSGLKIDDGISEDVGVSIGTGIGGISFIEEQIFRLSHADINKTAGKISPFFIPMIISNMASGLVSIKYNAKGYNASVVSACSTANHSIGDSMDMIRHGRSKVMITGGTEAAICRLAISGFDSMHALSKRNDTPHNASRPYDKDRDGFIMGEGCGILILEELEFAKARGAKIYCEISGYGVSSDAHHITAPTIEGPALAMKKALKDAGMSGKDIDYINAHGTSTPLGDINELDAISKALGDSESLKIPISSTKSMTGHLLGGAGGLEAIISILAMQNNFVPPSINIFNLDEKCRHNIIANKGIPAEINTVMSNSFGFGGTNATLIFKRFEE